jgi:peroxiredoxin
MIDVTLVAAITFAVLVLAALAILAWLVLVEQRRLRLRLDGIERTIERRAAAETAPAVPPRLRGAIPLAQSRIERQGLTPGTPAPLFALPNLFGGTVDLAQYRGREVLLVFTDPNCGPCEALLPHLKRLGEGGQGGREVILIGRGQASDNRRKAEAQGLRFPLVLQQQWELSRSYGIFATPVAFVIDERGVIAAPVAKGVDAIRQLLMLQPTGAR